jgi:hypothetical protein
MNEAERQTIEAFVLSSRRPRFAVLLDKPDRATQLERVLPHQRVLDDRFMNQVPPSEADSTRVEAILRAKGAPEMCRVIGGGELDDQELGLSEALGQIVGWNAGCIVICVPGRLAYFEGEDRNERYILER